MNRLALMVEAFEIDVKGVRKLLYEEVVVRKGGIQIVRPKRGLVNVLGYGIKYLFGTAGCTALNDRIQLVAQV